MQILGSLKLLLYLFQIVGRLSLAACHYIIILRAHILDLGKLQGAVLLALRERLTGNIRMDMHLERLVVLADNKAVTYARKVGAQRREVNVRLMLAHDVDRIERIGYLICSKHIERIVLICYNACLNRRRRSGHFAAQACEHSGENDDISHAAGIDNAGLLENGVLVNGVIERLFAYPDSCIKKPFDIIALFGIFDSSCRRHTGNCKYSALGRLHDGLIGCVNAVFHSGGKFLCANGLHALESARDSSEQKRQDNAGVSARTAQKRAGNAVGNGIDSVKLFFSKLGCGLVHSKAHIGSRIAVGYGEYVKFVYLLSVLSKRGIGAQDHVLEHRSV